MPLLLCLEPGEKVEELLEALLVPVHPDEVHLPQVEHASLHPVAPGVVAAWASRLHLQVSAHNGLEDGGKGSDADPSANQDGVFRPEDVARRTARQCGSRGDVPTWGCPYLGLEPQPRTISYSLLSRTPRCLVWAT